MRLVMCLLLIVMPVLAGCADSLETGYVPRKLNSSESERRAFYASRFSPEANVEKSSGTPPPSNPRWR
jgi:hypothetical protein